MEHIFTNWGIILIALIIATADWNTDVTEALQVTSSGPQTIQQAEGLTVDLGCTYTPGAADTGALDIEWSNVSPDMTQKDKLILSFTEGQTLQYGDPSLSSRLSFTGDPRQGDASVSISNLRPSDTATYQCKVKKAPGVDTRKLTLVVLVRPSVPKCWVDGSEEKGSNVKLRCRSTKGSAPLAYTWTRESGGAMPIIATQDPQSGELLIRNHSEKYAGNYVCEAKNAVGSERCKYRLYAHNPTNKVGVIVGAVIGALLLLLLLLLLIWLLIVCCRKRRYQKEVANEIREDAVAPESHPPSRQSSRHSSLRSVVGYRTHPGVVYSSVGKQPSRTGSGHSSVYTNKSQSSRQPTPAARAPPPPLKYDSKYGYPV